MAQLPEIELTCRNGHSFTSHARGGVAVSCPACRKAGNRVQVWVPKNRPRTEREARELTDRAALTGTPAGRSELADRWEREAPWAGGLVTLPGRPGDECGQCGGPLQWEPGRTMVHCPKCKGLRLPVAVAEHYRRQDQRSADVAVRTGPGTVDRTAERRAQVRLDARKKQMAYQVNKLMEAFDPDGLSGGAEHLAVSYRSGLEAYLRQIGNAGSEDELAEIEVEVKEIITQAETSGAVAEIERQREAMERQAEYARHQAELAEQAEREAREANRESQRQAAIEAQQRKAIESRAGQSTAVVSQSGYAAAMKSAAQLYGMYENRRKTRERRLDEYGPCGYQDEHKSPAIPDRWYWITTVDDRGNRTGYRLPDTPWVAVCKKHFETANAWIAEQAIRIAREQHVQVTHVFTELK